MLRVDIKKHFAGGSPFTLDVSFEAALGRGPVVMFGASGSGKSLTMQCISGIVRPDAGHISVRGRVLTDTAKKVFVPARERQIGYMFQEYALFPHLTVAQNVAYGLTGIFPQRLSASHKEHIVPILEMLDIAHLAHRFPIQISGGQRQRCALARALCINPRLLLLDEPFAALDPLMRHRLRQELRELLEQLDIPSIIITHEPEDVRVFADSLVLYAHGQAWVHTDFDRQAYTADTIWHELLRATSEHPAKNN